MDTTKLEIMAIDCMRHHGLMQQGWQFRWNERKTALGVCKHRYHRIEFSRPFTLLNTEDTMLDVVLHEIAHAVIGSRHGHDSVWQMTAQSLGARPERCAATAVEPPRKYQAACPKCGRIFSRHNMPRRDSEGRNPRPQRCKCYRGQPWDASQHLVYSTVVPLRSAQ